MSPLLTSMLIFQGRALSEENRQLVFIMGRSGLTAGLIVSLLRQKTTMARPQGIYAMKTASEARRTISAGSFIERSISQ